MVARNHDSRRLSFAALAIAAGALVLWRCQHLPAPSPPNTRDVADGSRRGITVPMSARGEHRATAPQRDPVHVPTAEHDPDAWLAHPFEVALEVRVVDADGAPVEGHQPRLGPVGAALQPTAAATGADGRVCVRWPTRLPAVRIELFDPRGHSRVVAVRHGSVRTVTLCTTGDAPPLGFAVAAAIGAGVAPHVRFACADCLPAPRLDELGRERPRVVPGSMWFHPTDAPPPDPDRGAAHDPPPDATAPLLRGDVRTFAGTPLVGDLVEWFGDDGASYCRGRIAADGSFALATRPAGIGQLLVWRHDARWPFPLADAANVRSDAGGFVRLTASTADSCLRMHVVAWPRALAPWAHVCQLATGTSVRAPCHGTADEPWQLDNLTAGWYQIGVHAGGSGAIDLGRHWLDGRRPLDLGTVALPAPGRVHIESRGNAPEAAELIALRADFDVRMEPFPGLDAEAALPAGDYALCSRRRGELKYTRFAVRPEATTRVTVPD